MKLALAVLVLCAAGLPEEAAGSPSQHRSGKDKNLQYASWDEVNILAHGLLQLGHGLKEHVDKSKGQIKDILAKLSSYNSTFTQLLKQTKEVKEEGDLLRSKVRQLESQEVHLAEISAALKEEMEEVTGERSKASERLENLEEKVQDILQSRVTDNNSSFDFYTMQSLMETQNKRIDDLLEKIKLQQQKLDKQNLRIKNLQSKVTPARKVLGENRLLEAINLQTHPFLQEMPPCFPSDCHQIYLEGETRSGVYIIQPFHSQPFEVYCEMKTGRGWTVIQRRMDGSVNFDQLWDAYRNGFGNLTGEFWLGLEKMVSISRQGRYILRVDLQDWESQSRFIEHPFSLGGQDTDYTLYLRGSISGNLESTFPDSMGLPFSTRDQDHDLKSNINCAHYLSGGWWFSSCGPSNLNGRYFDTMPSQRHERKQGIFWKTWKGRYHPLKSTTIKIQPAQPELEV
uniref:Angiopoietin like 4 n=1 Tax=Latimeria chalumnae TaxID=7897 RepID=H3BBS7_LATCH